MTQVDPDLTDPVEPVAPEGEVVDAPEFTLPEDFAQTVASWEVPVEELPEAVNFYKSIKTEEGVIDGFIRFGQALGFGTKELERLFVEEAAALATPAPTAAAPEPEEDPDRLVTLAEARDLLQREVLQPLEQQRAQAEQAAAVQRQENINRTIDGFFDTKEVGDKDVRVFIAQLAQKHIPPGANDYDPTVVTTALERGHAEYESLQEKQHQEYLRKKAAQAGAIPTPAGGGGTSGGDGDDRPDYSTLGRGALETARQRVRDRLRAAGELG